MVARIALAVALAVAPLSSAAVLRGQAFSGNGMQPEVVARTLSSVQDEWKAQADVFAECDSTSGLPGASIVNCADAPSSFGKSCSTVVGAIVQGSGGDKDVAKEYMSDVCSQSSMSGWHQSQCHSLALAVRGSMSADTYSNRMGFDSSKLCTSFWSGLLGAEKQRISKEKAEHEASEKKAAEEAAEQEKQDEEQRKKEAEQKKVQEAQRAKEEAQAKATEAAARLAQKKAEAEATQEAAKQKMEEAKEAEEEQDMAKQAAAAKAKAAQAKVAPATPPKPVAAPVPAKPVIKAAAVVTKAVPAKAEAAPVKVPVVAKAAPAAKPVKAAPAKKVETKH